MEHPPACAWHLVAPTPLQIATPVAWQSRHHGTLRTALALLALWGYGAAQAQTETVACHVSYGGETQVISAQPTPAPYTVAPTSIGSYFMFRVVFERQPSGLAAIKLYTYADREPPQGTVLLHQADYLYPPPPVNQRKGNQHYGHYGFTGLQRVYEPIRDGELYYWCELTK